MAKEVRLAVGKLMVAWLLGPFQCWVASWVRRHWESMDRGQCCVRTTGCVFATKVPSVINQERFSP